jgi:hypothetical protein
MSLPVVKQTAWISLLPQLGFMAFLMGLFYSQGIAHAIILGAGTYLIMSSLLRFFLLKHHNKGLKHNIR